MNGNGGCNPLAEIRRLRKLENERLEAEAKQRQEELRMQQENERQRAENERIAEEQRKLYELQQIRMQKVAEQERIASIEHAERQVIGEIEKKLRLVGAFCTAELSMPTPEALPLCASVLSLAALEKPIPTLEDDVIFIADSSPAIHVFTAKEYMHLFTVVWSKSYGSVSVRDPVAMPYRLPNAVCDQAYHGIVIIDLRQLFQSFHIEALSHRAPVAVDGESSCLAYIGEKDDGGNELFASPQGLAFDDTSNELYITDQGNHCVQVLAFSSGSSITSRNRPAGRYGIPIGQDSRVIFDRSFGSKGHECGQLCRPSGLDVSHYHVVVCDLGGSRLVIFTKRGVFVRVIGCKGIKEAQFLDIHDVKLVNVRKTVITRGLLPDANTISNEQFDIIVADLGNVRVQILNQNGDFLRQFSLFANPDQAAFQKDLLNRIYASLLHEYAAIKQKLPSLEGSAMIEFYALATVLHPSSPAYTRIMQAQAKYRHCRSRSHHPSAITYASAEKKLIVVDRANAKVYSYNEDGSHTNWRKIPTEPLNGISSIHSCVKLLIPQNAREAYDRIPSESANTSRQMLFVSDPLSHRVVAFKYLSNIEFQFYIGASTYGDQTLCSSGYLAGELNHPSFLTFFTVHEPDETIILVVSDSGNHCVSLFEASTGEFWGRIGGGFGHTEGYMDSPQGVAVLDNQLLFICDQRNHRIQVFDIESRKFVRSFGRFGNRSGELNFPTAVAVCSALPSTPKCDFGSHRSAKVLVSDTCNNRLQVFDLDGNGQLVLDTQATPLDHIMTPIGVFIEPRSGYLLACDPANRCVMIFRNDGTYVTSFGANMEPENCFQRPLDLVITANGELLIIDERRCQICAFSL